MAGGAAVSALAAVIVLGILPFARRWGAREAEIAARAEQVARLEALVAREPEFRAAVGTGSAPAARGRLLAGNTPAVAASALQLLIKRYADQSRVLLDRVDVVGQTRAATGGLTAVPVQLHAQGDISGLVDLLFYLQNGRELLVVDEVRVSAARASRSDAERLSWSIRLHGLFVPGAGAGEGS